MLKHANKQVLFSVTKKDLIIEYFRASGPGGQKVNKTSSACRIKHLASGAIGESREERHQPANRKIAFNRLVKSDKFQRWVRIQAAMVEQGFRDVEDKVDRAMRPENLEVVYQTRYTCDTCCKTEMVVTSDPNHRPDWIGYDDKKKDEHYCKDCLGER